MYRNGKHRILLVVHHDVTIAHEGVLRDEFLDHIVLDHDIAPGDKSIQLRLVMDFFESGRPASLSRLGCQRKGDLGEKLVHRFVVHFCDRARDPVLHAGRHCDLLVIRFQERFPRSGDDLKVGVLFTDPAVDADIGGSFQYREEDVIAVFQLFFDRVPVYLLVFAYAVYHDLFLRIP